MNWHLPMNFEMSVSGGMTIWEEINKNIREFYKCNSGSVTNTEFKYVETDISLNEEEILARKKSVMLNKGESTSKRTREILKPNKIRHQNPKYTKYYEWKFWKTSVQV